MSWEKWEASTEKGPTSITLRFIFWIAMIAVIVGLIGIPLGWFSEAASVAQKEFGSKAALQKYEWFIDQSERIKKMDKDVAIFENRLKELEKTYSSYGEDRAKWPADVRIQYNHERSIGSDDLVAIKSQRNSLVQEYNAQSEKFNWKPFLTRDDKPAEKFETYGL